MGRLTVTGIKGLVKKPGRHGDGDGLFLQVGSGGSASWIVRVQKDGRRRDIGVGSLAKVSLSLARERASQIRTQVEIGVDPVMERQRKAGVPTFRVAAAQVHAEHKKSWKNGKHRDQWLSSLEAYAFPTLGDMPVDKIETGHVRDVLGPIWIEKPETARRVRQRIGTVLDYAVGKNWREHALSTNVITKALPRQPKTDRHFEAMRYEEVPAFLNQLRERSSMGRLALEALILTAVRSGEVRGARWSELDLEAKRWTIPAERMKAKKQHVVPLSAPAVDVFRRAKQLRISGEELVFRGAKRGRPMSDMTLTKVLRDAGRSETTHGFRSSFRDWAAEKSDMPGEVAEAALAHAIPDKTEAAYRRTDFVEKRLRLMQDWGAFCVSAALETANQSSAD